MKILFKSESTIQQILASAGIDHIKSWNWDPAQKVGTIEFNADPISKLLQLLQEDPQAAIEGSRIDPLTKETAAIRVQYWAGSREPYFVNETAADGSVRSWEAYTESGVLEYLVKCFELKIV